MLALVGRACEATEARGRDNGKVPWSTYYAGVEGDVSNTNRQWRETIWPLIESMTPNFESVLEIAPGGGRWAEKLGKLATRYVGVDINVAGIKTLLKPRFATSHHMQFYANDGLTLPMIPNASVSFVFSFDSMVHFSPESMESYARELGRVLRPGGGSAFLHHSGLQKCQSSDPCMTAVRDPHNPRGNHSFSLTQACVPWVRPRQHSRGVMNGNNSCGIEVHATKNPFARNVMGCKRFEQLVTDSATGLMVARQEPLVWGPPSWCSVGCGHKFTINDCLTLLRRA